MNRLRLVHVMVGGESMLDRLCKYSGPVKPRLAIVSTFDELCGIAGYTRCLTRQLAEHFDIEVFDLDQFFMRSNKKKVRKLADQMIRDFCKRASDFDCVNIQLEHGTLGGNHTDIWHRFQMIAEAAPSLCVTFHTIPQKPFPWRGWWRSVKLGQIVTASQIIITSAKNRLMSSRIDGLLLRLQSRKRVSVIVHTRRDMHLMKYVNGFKSVFSHPLAFLSSDEVRSIREKSSRADFPILASLPADAKIIGVFGFLNEYKGFDTAIRAMQHLPANYHLAIFGGLHPNEIKEGQPVNHYVRKLMDETFADRSVIESMSKMSMSVTSEAIGRLFDHPMNIGSRVHFMGTQTDEGFTQGMAVCDMVVLPYHEIGQSSSGPMSLAVEMQSRILASRNFAFMQFARFHPDVIEFFEIGNHLELAERIRVPGAMAPARQPKYNHLTNTEVYITACTQKEQCESDEVDARTTESIAVR